jgi:hypothetical protein
MGHTKKKKKKVPPPKEFENDSVESSMPCVLLQQMKTKIVLLKFDTHSLLKSKALLNNKVDRATCTFKQFVDLKRYRKQ